MPSPAGAGGAAGGVEGGREHGGAGAELCPRLRPENLLAGAGAAEAKGAAGPQAEERSALGLVAAAHRHKMALLSFPRSWCSE